MQGAVCRDMEGWSSWLLLVCLQSCPWGLVLQSCWAARCVCSCVAPWALLRTLLPSSALLHLTSYFPSLYCMEALLLSLWPLSRVLVVVQHHHRDWMPLQDRRERGQSSGFQRYCFALPATGFLSGIPQLVLFSNWLTVIFYDYDCSFCSLNRK